MSVIPFPHDYAAIRRRLINPPNAVPDPGIDLRRRVSTKPRLTEEPAPEFAPQIPDFRETKQHEVVTNLPVINIIRLCSAAYGVKISDLISRRRFARPVRVRQIAIYIAREITTLTMPQLARRFGGRDHTTILHSCRKIAALRKVDPVLNDQIEQLIAILSSGRKL